MLSPYNVNAETKITADASAYGLGAVITQKQSNSEWRPVAYASRSMTETEKHYSQIEKEALALVWACEKFSDYILGKAIMMETDHKPLVPLLSKTTLSNLPPRILRFRLRLARFQYEVKHVPGKLLYTADTLSRAPVKGDVETVGCQELCLIHSLDVLLPASQNALDKYRQAQQEDPICCKLMEFTQDGWPSKHQIKGYLKRYWQERNQFTMVEDLLLYGVRIVVPQNLRRTTLQKIHNGHQGFQKCYQRISTSVWWPGISKDLERFIKECLMCLKTMPVPTEPLLQSPLPKYPWQKVASDLFELKGISYLLVVDYYSQYIEVQKLTSTTSSAIITALKAVFSRHGIPSVLVSDNGPQYVSEEMKSFATAYGFSHITSSPHYPKSNGLAERSVRTVKSILSKSTDSYIGLLSYRATPLPWCGMSPAQLLMGRRLRTDVPQVEESFIPDWSHLQDFENKDKQFKRKQKKDYDRRHRVRDLSPIPDNTPVWVNTRGTQIPGTVARSDNASRSYWLQTPSGEVRRNRRDVIVQPELTESQEPSVASQERPTSSSRTEEAPNMIATRSRTGTVIRPPERLTYH